MKEELISVIVPVYNSELYLEECIDSILNQTYKYLEIILVDDGSMDLSGEICDKYAEKDGRIKVIHQKNCGSQAARNKGIENAKGQYIGFVDSDDWIDEDMYEILYKNIGFSDLVTSGIWFYNKDGTKNKCLDLFEPAKYNSHDAYFWNNLIISSKYEEGGMFGGIINNLTCKLFRTSIVKKCYLVADINIRNGEDLLFTLIYTLRCNEVVVTNECCYHHRFNPVSVSHSNNMNYVAEMNRFYVVLKQTITNHVMEKSLMKQLNRIFMFLLYSYTSSMMQINSDVCYPQYIFPSNELLYEKRVVLFGAGQVGKSYYNDWKYHYNINIVLWIDNALIDSEIYGNKILRPEKILLIEYDYIVCAVLNKTQAKKMKRQMMELGVNENQIVWKCPQNIFLELFLKRNI